MEFDDDARLPLGKLLHSPLQGFAARSRGVVRCEVDLDGVSEDPRLRLHCRDLGHLGFFRPAPSRCAQLPTVDHFLDDALDLHCDDLLNDLSLTTRRQRRGPRGAKTQHPG